MYAKKLQTRHGVTWFVEGVHLWWRKPFLITGMMLSGLMVLMVLGGIPVVGELLSTLLMPVVWLIVINGCRDVDQHKNPSVEALFYRISMQRVKALAVVGFIYFLLGILTVSAFLWLNNDFLQALKAGVSLEEALAQNPGTWIKMAGVGVLTLPVLMGFWFAPVLCGWWRISPFKAYFFSFYACLQNWRPFAVLAIGIVLMGSVLPQLILQIIAFFIPVLIAPFLLVFLLCFFSVLFAVLYTSTRDVFGLPTDV